MPEEFVDNYKRILEEEMEHLDEDRIAIGELIIYFGEENLSILDSMIKKK